MARALCTVRSENESNIDSLSQENPQVETPLSLHYTATAEHLTTFFKPGVFAGDKGLLLVSAVMNICRYVKCREHLD